MSGSIGDDGLAGHAQRLSARCQHPQVRAGAEQSGGQFGAAVDDVLAVVEDEQRVTVAHEPAHCVQRGNTGYAAADLQVSAPSRRPRRCPGATVASSTSQITSRGATGLAAGKLERQTRLSHAARTRQRQQPGTTQLLPDHFELTRPANQRRRWDRQIPGREINPDVDHGPPSALTLPVFHPLKA